jgi:hypothetical protein
MCPMILVDLYWISHFDYWFSMFTSTAVFLHIMPYHYLVLVVFEKVTLIVYGGRVIMETVKQNWLNY